MRYKVVGQNRDTGARMTLEFEAGSKAAAERKASQAGMSVHHVADVVNGGERVGDHAPAANYRGPVRTGSRGVLRLVVILVLLALVAWFLWPQIRGVMNRRARTMLDGWNAVHSSAMTMPWTHSPSSGWTTSRSS